MAIIKGPGRRGGKGHQGNTPNLPIIRERPDWPTIGLEPGSKAYQMGKVKIIVSPPYAGRGWHISISCRERYPTWDEIAHVWYKLIPGADKRNGAMILPPVEEYVNIHSFCFHIHEINVDKGVDHITEDK